MTISAAQVREARDLLGWRTPMLAKRASVGFDIALRAQKDPGLPATMSLQLRAIRDAFERAGVRLTLDAEGRPAVELARAKA